MVYGRYNYSIHGGYLWFKDRLITGGPHPVWGREKKHQPIRIHGTLGVEIDRLTAHVGCLELICFRKSQPGIVQAVLLGGDGSHGIFLVNLWLIYG